jgi:hypothetical protein
VKIWKQISSVDFGLLDNNILRVFPKIPTIRRNTFALKIEAMCSNGTSSTGFEKIN